MSEWVSFLAIFWALWAADGLKLAPAAIFGVRGTRLRAGFLFHRLNFSGWLPHGWYATTADIPFSMSPAGICNRPVGAAGRPTETPWQAQAWAWEDIDDVVAKDGWWFINQKRFCRHTGHMAASQLRDLARLGKPVRDQKVSWWLHRWLRPGHLRRRVRILRRDTATSAMLNAWFFGLVVWITIHLTGNFGLELPSSWNAQVGRMLPYLAGYLLLLHLVAVLLAWRALRRLPAVREDKRRSALFSAVLLPPQALRLRALTSAAYLPPQHPLAYAVAFAGQRDLEEMAFAALGSLRWPIDGKFDAPLAKEITGWYRAALHEQLETMLRAAGLDTARLFVTPFADGLDCCAYCPRCRTQFVIESKCCPHGVELLPLAKRPD